jgi:hypothetical protein
MLTCREMSEQTSDYIEGRVRWYKAIRIRLHLLVCHSCDLYVRKMRLLLATIRGVKPDQPPVDPAGIVEKIEQRREHDGEFTDKSVSR